MIFYSSKDVTLTIGGEVYTGGFDVGVEQREPRHGASEETLFRRLTYGGRKGRSAARRLRARGVITSLTLTGVTAWQKIEP